MNVSTSLKTKKKSKFGIGEFIGNEEANITDYCRNL